jgi:hypothetical protein
MSPKARPPDDPVAAVRELLSGDAEGHARTTFVRGLTLGALVGAAIAGSLLVRRRPGAGRAPGPPDGGPG